MSGVSDFITSIKNAKSIVDFLPISDADKLTNKSALDNLKANKDKLIDPDTTVVNNFKNEVCEAYRDIMKAIYSIANDKNRKISNNLDINTNTFSNKNSFYLELGSKNI